MAASKVWAPIRRRLALAWQAKRRLQSFDWRDTLRRVPNFRRVPQSAVNGSLRCRGYLQNCFLQFLHINRFGEMSGKAGAAASLHVLLHPITADGDALGIADL